MIVVVVSVVVVVMKQSQTLITGDEAMSTDPASQGVQRLREGDCSVLERWFQAHEWCPACAVFRGTPCAVEFALYNATRETAGRVPIASTLGSLLDACVARNGWIVHEERAEPLIEKALKTPREQNAVPPGSSERLVQAAGMTNIPLAR